MAKKDRLKRFSEQEPERYMTIHEAKEDEAEKEEVSDEKARQLPQDRQKEQS